METISTNSSLSSHPTDLPVSSTNASSLGITSESKNYLNLLILHPSKLN
jgi:hypothetical protein